MHWGFRYLGRHAAQKVLGAIPYRWGIQEFVKRATSGAERFTDAGYVRRRLTPAARFGDLSPEQIAVRGFLLTGSAAVIAR